MSDPVGSLRRLPPEILEQVTLQISQHADLLALCLVSSTFGGAGQTVLYRDVNLDIYELHATQPPDFHVRVFALLLRTILLRPDLALSCKSFRVILGGYDEDCDPDPKYPSSRYDESLRLNAPDRETARCLISTVQPDDPGYWMMGVDNGRLDATLTLLVCCFPMLQELELDIDYRPNMKILNHFLLGVAFRKESPLVFKSLRSFRYHRKVCDGYGRTSWDRSSTPEACALFRLRGLRCLKASFVETNLDCSLLMSHFPTLPDLKTLVLEKESCVSVEALTVILENTGSLEHLTYEFCCNGEDLHDLTRYFQSDAVGVALGQVASTLRSLVISCTFKEPAGADLLRNDAWGFRGRIGSLVDFPKLQELEIPLVVLLGWSSSSHLRLKDLVLSWCPWTTTWLWTQTIVDELHSVARENGAGTCIRLSAT